MTSMVYFGQILKSGMKSLRLADNVRLCDFQNPMGCEVKPWILDDIRMDYQAEYGLGVNEVTNILRTGRLTITMNDEVICTEDFFKIQIGTNTPKPVAGGYDLRAPHPGEGREIPLDARLTIDVSFAEPLKLERNILVRVYLKSKDDRKKVGFWSAKV